MTSESVDSVHLCENLLHFYPKVNPNHTIMPTNFSGASRLLRCRRQSSCRKGRPTARQAFTACRVPPSARRASAGLAGGGHVVLDRRPGAAWATARRLLLASGRIGVTVEHFADATLGGDVIGTAGGSVTNVHGDQLDVPAASVTQNTAFVLERREVSDLPLGEPSVAEVEGVIALSFDAAELAHAAAFTLALPAEERPQAEDTGLLLLVVEVG